MSNNDLKEIARATGASHFRTRNGQLQLFRERFGIGWQIGEIESGRVEWRKYPSLPFGTEEIR